MPDGGKLTIETDKGAASPTQPATAGAPPSGKGQLVLVVRTMTMCGGSPSIF